MKKITFFTLFCILTTMLVAQNKMQLSAGVMLESNWPDSIQVETYYDFKLSGNNGRIANISIKVKSGILEKMPNNTYKAKVGTSDKQLHLEFSKYDPMEKKNTKVKEIILPVKE